MKNERNGSGVNTLSTSWPRSLYNLLDPDYFPSGTDSKEKRISPLTSPVSLSFLHANVKY